MTKSAIVAGALSLALASTVHGQRTAGGSAGRVAAVDEYMGPLLELQVFSGTLLVARGDTIALERSYGLADVEQHVSFTDSTVFRIASISKSFTRALLGRLSDQGRLSVDDRLSRWLPKLPSSDRITLRMLLDHRSGIKHVNSLPYDEEAIESNSLKRLVDSIARLPLDFEPGTARRYSNGGYAVLARVIELAAGDVFGAVLEREILTPLQLSQTAHEADGTIVRHAARGYMPSPEIAGRLVRAPFQEMDTKTGGGSMVSSARDLVKWMRAIGRSEILREATWADLFPRKDSVFAFDGRAPGFNVFVSHDRKRDATTVVLANNYSAGMVGDVAVAAEAIALGSSPKALPVEPPAESPNSQLRSLVGRYGIPDGALPVPPGSAVDLKLVNGHLVVCLGPTPVDVLVPQQNGTFLARTLWSMVEPGAKTGDIANSITVRALYRDHSFSAARVTK